MQQQKPRIEWIDLAKGICICSVVYNHVVSGHVEMQNVFDNMFLTLRMPLYFFLSGLFFKPYAGFFNFALRKVNKLLVPFAVFHFLTAVVWMIVTDALATRLTLDRCAMHTRVFLLGFWDGPLPNGPLWFLLCLFVMNLMFYGCVSLASRFSRGTLAMLLLTFGIGLCGYGLSILDYRLPMFLDTAMTALPFFSMGYCVRKYTDMLVPNRLDRWNLAISLLCAVGCFLWAGTMVAFAINRYDVNPVRLYLGSFLGVSSVLFLAKSVRRLPLISYFGRYSIVILVSHWFLFPYVQRVVELAHWPIVPSLLVTFVVTMLCYVAVIPLFLRYLPHVTAQKDVFPVEKR